MTRALHRRLDRLSGRFSAGRLITLSVAHEHADDADMINATLAAAGIKREDGDLIVLLKIYAALGSEPPCTLQSVLPLAPNGLKVLR
ncbi:MAG TPA: hypothetical protein VM686_05900 [Polyangiaceae bacterium]|nr:hypothetical protein [Polyangiaceae bacterium]